MSPIAWSLESIRYKNHTIAASATISKNNALSPGLGLWAATGLLFGFSA